MKRNGSPGRVSNSKCSPRATIRPYLPQGPSAKPKPEKSSALPGTTCVQGVAGIQSAERRMTTGDGSASAEDARAAAIAPMHVAMCFVTACMD